MNSDEILIVQCQIPLKPQKANALQELILKQRETGVILLPHYCTVITKPKDIDIQVEEEAEELLIPYEKLNVGDTFKMFKDDERVFRREKEGAIQIRDSSGNHCEELGNMIYPYIGCAVYKEE